MAARGLASWLLGSGLLGVVLVSTTASAAPIELVEQRGQYLLFDDVDGSVEGADWFSRDGFLAGYAQVEAGLLAVHPDDSQFIVVYTTWTLPAGIGAFFQSVANDVQGIGFAHIAAEDPVIPAEFFDDTPDSQVQGMLHMNRWTQYLGSDDGGVDEGVISLIFGQELGHAWGSFVYFDQGMGAGWETTMLGRANAHWSFYLDSGGSPMQGHPWADNGDGTFTASKPEVFLYSDLDLYLMGLLPADEVAPWFLLEDPSSCVDAASGDGVCAPPDAFRFEADTYTIDATRRDITIDDVLAVEGLRVPAWPDAPDEFDVSFVLVKRPDEVLSYDELAALDVIIERTIELFELQTRGLGRVVNRTVGTPPLPPDDTGGDETVDGSGGTADATGDAEGSGDGGSTAAGDDDGGGCGCRAEGSGPGQRLPWLLALLALRPRRSRVA
ncbi:MAG: hypothetical protein KC501_05005 [Myxococcales bacterium]|nr:hypothetical protein [Myxococcales bacterium]